MVLLIVSALVAVCGVAWAATAGSGAVASLDKLLNAAGILGRIVHVIAGIRDVAVWLYPAFAGGNGRGPVYAGSFTPAQGKPSGGSPAASRSPRSPGSLATDMSDFEEVPF